MVKLGNGQGHHWTPSVSLCYKLCTGFNSITINQSAFLRVCAQLDHSVLHPLWMSKVAVQIFNPAKSAPKTQVVTEMRKRYMVALIKSIESCREKQYPT